MSVFFILHSSMLWRTVRQSMVKLSKKIKNDPRKQTNKNIEDGVADIKAGRVCASVQVKKKLGLQ